MNTYALAEQYRRQAIVILDLRARIAELQGRVSELNACVDAMGKEIQASVPKHRLTAALEEIHDLRKGIG